MNNEWEVFEGTPDELIRRNREFLKEAYPTYETLLDAAANYLFMVFQLGAESQGLFDESLLNALVNSDDLSIDKRLSALENSTSATAGTINKAIGLHKSSAAQRGGKAKAEISAAQDRAIIEQYNDHTELHGLSGDKAATSLIDKHPEITADLGISHRRIANLIRAERKCM